MLNVTSACAELQVHVASCFLSSAAPSNVMLESRIFDDLQQEDCASGAGRMQDTEIIGRGEENLGTSRLRVSEKTARDGSGTALSAQLGGCSGACGTAALRHCGTAARPRPKSNQKAAPIKNMRERETDRQRARERERERETDCQREREREREREMKA